MTTMSAQEYQALVNPKSKGNKYNAKKVTIQGITFDSQREGQRFLCLRDMQKRGQISDLRLQVPIMLMGQKGPVLTRAGRQMRLTVDFAYTLCETGATVYEDAKGMPTRDYEVRKAVAEAMGLEVVEV